MEQKYWVPALKKTNDVLQAVALEPHQLKLMELSKRLLINKSSMFSLLQTMETLGWVVRDKGDTYALGSFFGQLGNAYFRQYDLIQSFQLEARITKLALGETIQLAKLEGNETLYLAKEEALTPVRMASEPGMKFPAHATALGKVMLAQLPQEEWHFLYPTDPLSKLTPQTMVTRNVLFDQLVEIREAGYAYDLQESVIGFCCVSAPIFTGVNHGIAAVSCSIPTHLWELKKELATKEIRSLASRLSSS